MLELQLVLLDQLAFVKMPNLHPRRLEAGVEEAHLVELGVEVVAAVAVVGGLVVAVVEVEAGH